MRRGEQRPACLETGLWLTPVVGAPYRMGGKQARQLCRAALGPPAGARERAGCNRGFAVVLSLLSSYSACKCALPAVAPILSKLLWAVPR